jgi:signal transduction histidine kinase
VSDDVPVARPPRAVTQATSAHWRLWDTYFAVVVVAVVIINVLTHRHEVAALIWSTVLLIGMAAGYALVGRSLLRADEVQRPAYPYLAVLLLAFAAAVALVSTTAFLLFGLVPLVYATIGLHRGHRAVALANLIPAAVIIVQSGDVRAGIYVALPIGLLAMASSIFTASTIGRIERLSAERAALIDKLTSARAELARLSREAGVGEERQRLAGEIHDTVAQGLSSVVMLVEAADAVLIPDPESARRHLDLAARTARENLAEARAIVAALTPGQLDEASLADALRRLGERFGAETGIPVEHAREGESRPLATSVEVVLLRVAQESLSNVRKHAGASTVMLRLSLTPDTVTLEIRDDGCGFDPSTMSSGYGLDAMRGRVEQVGGRLAVLSTPDRGTTIRTELDA